MKEFNQLFSHLVEYKVVVCIQCESAIVPKQFDIHIRVQHPAISLQQRKQIVEYVKDLPVAILKQEVSYPNSYDNPIIGLPVFHNGLKCIWQERSGERCGYICQTRQGI